ncbi:MAG: Hsp20/alpha crystallin family protein [Anaerolineae bacterium]
MSILNWDPMEEIQSLQREMGRFMEERLSPFGGTRYGRGQQQVMRLPLDAYATSEEIVIIASVPGLSADDVEITLVGDTLTVKGEFRRPLENVDYMFLERPYGLFSRSVKINVPINTDQVEAKFESGQLMIILPKAEEAKPRVIEVKKE